MTHDSDPSSPAPRPRGRPRVAEPKSHLSVRLSAQLHDRVIAVALADQASVSSTVRQALERHTKKS